MAASSDGRARADDLFADDAETASEEPEPEREPEPAPEPFSLEDLASYDDAVGCLLDDACAAYHEKLRAAR